MSSPWLATAGNVLWTSRGATWAVWQLQGLDYGYRPDRDKRLVRAMHTQLLRALQGESLLLGLVTRVEPERVVEAMIDGVDLEQCQDWAVEADASLDRLQGLPLGERTFWLAAPLRVLGWRRLLNPLQAVGADVTARLGLPRWRPSGAQIEGALRDAEALVRSSVPSAFDARAATPAQMQWLLRHPLCRGLDEPPVPTAGEDLALGGGVVRGGATLGRPLLEEGGLPDDRRRWLRMPPLRRRWLKVQDSSAPEGLGGTSYQVAMVLDDVPAGGMVFPGTEYLGRLDEFVEADVDWVIRLRMLGVEASQRKIRKTTADLADQHTQREGALTTGQHELARATDDLTALEGTLQQDRNEVPGEATIMFLLGGDDPGEVQAQATELAQVLARADFRLAQPLGGQEALWWASQPGTVVGPEIRQLAQTVTGSDLAASCPLTTTRLGDRRGLPFALNITTTRPDVVMLDLESTILLKDQSAAIGVAGDLGGGKSVASKVIAGSVMDRGGRLLTIDRTQSGEWSRFASAYIGTTTVRALQPQVSLDPLRLFPGPVGARIAQSFLQVLLNVAATSPQGRRLSAVLEPGYRTQHGLHGLGDLCSHLEGSSIELDREIASYLRTFASKDLGRCVFDPSLPPVDLRGRGVVFNTAGIQLPSREETVTPHLFAHMRIERIFGRALYALFLAAIRIEAFRDPRELVVVPFDESSYLTSSPESENELVELTRDCRKHTSAIILASHDPIADFGSETLRGLIPTRIATRQSDETLAARSLEWLGLDPSDRELVQLLSRQTSPVDPVSGRVPEARRGEALMRDSLGRIGRIKILAPARADRAAAVLTTPGARADDGPFDTRDFDTRRPDDDELDDVIEDCSGVVEENGALSRSEPTLKDLRRVRTAGGARS
jgi:hypothetical protein